MSVDAEQKCSECGGGIPAGAAHCPACMLGRVMGGEDSLGDLAGATTTSLDRVPITEGAGDTIGNYKLLEKIGEGGFGVVYMAKQERPLRRQVALKIIKLGMDTKQVVGRFEAERQALAMMDHPNIAKVLDAGTTETGRPFFVMELVHGIPLTEFCNENRLTPEARLRLFIKVCNAVQHAHQKGIIHRDLKPSNILVTMHDDDAVPKVIDFGIAKATQHDLTDKTLFTQFRHFLGTPAYMSPEQAQMSGLGVDTRSDIYSLGVLLYELLTGMTPLDLREAQASGYEEVARCIREEDPIKPSTRLSQLSDAAQTTLSKQSRSSFGGLQTQLRGDLDWIVMKAIEKDRSRRYETANLFAQDVALYLKDEPVSAAAPSAWYLLQKLARRHKPLFVSLALVLPVLLITAAVSASLFWKERKTNAALRQERSQRETLTDRLGETVLELEASVTREQRLRYLGDLDLAKSYIQSSRFGEADDILARYRSPNVGDPDVREFAWFYLNDQIANTGVRYFGDVGEGLKPTGFSSDGNLLLARSSQKEFSVWDVRLRQRVATVPIPSADYPLLADYSDQRFRSPSFSPDDGYIMMQGFRGGKPAEGESFPAFFWRVEEGQFPSLPTLEYHVWPIDTKWNLTRAVMFVPNSSLVAYSSTKDPNSSVANRVELFDLDRSVVVGNLPDAGTIQDISPDGQVIVTQRWDLDPPVTQFWDIASRELKREVPGLTDQYVRYFDSERVLVQRYNGRIRLLDTESLEEVALPAIPTIPVTNWQRSDDGHAYVIDSDPSLGSLFWNSKNGAPVSYGFKALLSPDGRMVAYGHSDGRIALLGTRKRAGYEKRENVAGWRLSMRGDELLVSPAEGRDAEVLSVSNLSSSRIAIPYRVAGAEAEGAIWTVRESGESVGAYSLIREGGAFLNNRIDGLTSDLVSMRQLNSDELLFHYGRLLEVRDRDSLTIKRRKIFQSRSFGSMSDHIPEESLYIPGGGEIATLQFISTKTLDVVETLDTGPVQDVVYLEREKCLVVFLRSGRIQEYSMPERTLVRDVPIGKQIRRGDVSSDGRNIVVRSSAAGAGFVEVYERLSLVPVLTISIEDARARNVMFSPRNDRLLISLESFDGKSYSLRSYHAPRDEGD